MSASVPEHLPLLSRGAHANPDEGACLMEYVALLAGQPFSDRPRCTHPLLARIARRVNDISSEAARSELAPLAPQLVGTASGHPGVAPALVLCCAEAALRADPSAVRLRRHARRARRRLARVEQQGSRGRWVRMSATCYRHGWAEPDIEDALAVLVDCSSGRQRDELLRQLLVDATAACRRFAQPATADDRPPQPVPV